MDDKTINNNNNNNNNKEDEVVKESNSSGGNSSPISPSATKKERSSPLSSSSSSGGLLSYASRAFSSSSSSSDQKKKVVSSPEKIKKFASFNLLKKELFDEIHDIRVPAGSPSGYLFRNYTMLHKYERLFYCIDMKSQCLIEYEDDNNDDSKVPILRTVLSIRSARIDDELQRFHSPLHQLYCWKIFFKSEKEGIPGKMYMLGATSIEVAQSWLSVFRKASAIGGNSNNNNNNNNKMGNRGFSVESDLSKFGLFDSTSHEKEESGSVKSFSTDPSRSAASPIPPSVSWKQDVAIDGQIYRIPCSNVYTNAMLLSEAIRAYVRYMEGTSSGADVENKIIEYNGLYNKTQNKLVDLGDDVETSVQTGDVLEAVVMESFDPSELQQQMNNKKSPISSKKTSPLSRRRRSSVPTPLSLVVPPVIHLQTSKQQQQQQELASFDERCVVINQERRYGGCFLEDLSNLFDKHMLANRLKPSINMFLDDRNDQLEKLMKQFNKLCAATERIIPFWPSKDWTNSKRKNDVRIFSNRKRNETGTLGMLTIQANPDRVLEKYLDINGRFEWDPYLDQVRYLEMGKNSDVVFYELNLPLTKRSFTVSRFWHRLSDGTYIILETPSVHPCKPTSSSMSGEHHAAFALRPFRESQSGYDLCLVVALFNVEVKAPLFSSWVSKRSQESIAGILGGLQEACCV